MAATVVGAEEQVTAEALALLEELNPKIAQARQGLEGLYDARKVALRTLRDAGFKYPQLGKLCDPPITAQAVRFLLEGRRGH